MSSKCVLESSQLAFCVCERERQTKIYTKDNEYLSWLTSPGMVSETSASVSEKDEVISSTG
jgi:hypothetical protein